MKENEIPEKIYLSYETNDEDYKDHIFIDYMWYKHPFEGKNLKNVEYTRTDAFIEKACDAYCEVCGHFAHSVPTHICRHDCRYFSDFKTYILTELTI